MPDVWTLAPQKLKSALIAQGAVCEVEPRVLLDRDPFWTCHINSYPISYDIYIRNLSEYLLDWQGMLPWLILVFIFGLFFGLLYQFLRSKIIKV